MNNPAASSGVSIRSTSHALRLVSLNSTLRTLFLWSPQAAGNQTHREIEAIHPDRESSSRDTKAGEGDRLLATRLVGRHHIGSGYMTSIIFDEE